MAKLITTLLLLCFIYNTSNSQPFRYYQTGVNSPRFIKPGTVSDTLDNALAGGLNTPQFSNIDWNGDGKQDLFIFDREALKPLAYVYDVAKQKFIHAPQYEGAFRNYLTGWALLRDHNHDGKPDLFTASFSHNKVTENPYVLGQNVQLYVNEATPGGKRYFRQYNNVVKDTGMFVGPPFNQTLLGSPMVAVENAVPSLEDMDGDGDLDFLTNQGVAPTSIYYENLKKNKYNINFPDDTVVYVMRDKCWGFINYVFTHHYQLGFNRSQSTECLYHMWGKTASKHADQTMLMIDLNGDGIKDVIFGDSEHKSLIALINGRLQNSLGIDSIISQDTLFLSTNGQRKNFIEFPSTFYVDTDGDNKQELLITTNKTFSSRSVDNIWTYDATRVNSNLQFTPKGGSNFLYSDMIDHGSRSVPAFTDVDGDGDKDLVVSTSGILERTNNITDRFYLYLNITDSIHPVFKLADSNFAGIAPATGRGISFAHPAFGDLNGDGKDDLLVGASNGSLAYYVNNSNGSNYQYTFIDSPAFGLSIGTFPTPQLVDLDRDGRLDIVCGQRNGCIQFFRNTGTKTAPAFNTVPTIDTLGKINSREVYKAPGIANQLEYHGYSAPHITDLNRDGVYDILVGSSGGRIYVFTNIYPHKDSVAKEITDPFVDYGLDDNAGYSKRFGSRTTVATAYLNGDSLPDIIVGNIAGGLIFLGTSYVEDTTEVGMKELYFDKDALKIFPNPASDKVFVDIIRTSATPVNYVVADVMGRIIKQGRFAAGEQQPSIDTGDMISGLYFIHFTTGTWQSSQRLIIAR